MSKVQQYPNDVGPDFRLRPLPGLLRQTLFVSAGALLVQGATLEQAQAGPQGGNVTAGQGQINTPNASTTVVQQQSHSLVVNWQTFNIAKNELVQFNQPSASASVLNRVLNQTPSQIFGSVNANGKVFLLNPSGVVIGKNARVNVGSLFMSSLDISDDDFMSGHYKFAKKDGSPVGAVINRGLIQAATGGSVTLVGEHVSNEGVIVADAGHVNLAAGRTATVDFNGDGLIRFEVDSEVVENATGADAAVANSGEIHADGGQVLLTASTASQVFDRAVNNRGLVRAGSINKVGGKVTLSGFGGGVVNTGTVDASGTRGGEVRMVSDSVIEQFGTVRAEGSSGDGGLVQLASVDTTLVGDGSLTSVRSDSGKGGLVEVLGDKVGLFGYARVDASGATGGGTALIGGDYQGANAEVQNAKRTYVANDVLISANADVAGGGGKVIVWADEVTRFFGKVSAQGGSTSGDGGFVEISGKQGLTFLGDVDTRAANGLAGTLLLDPDFISIIDGAASTGDQDANLSADDTVAFADANTAANTVSVGQINAATGSVAINAGQIDFNNSTDIAMGAGLSISFTADNGADANSAGGDNTIRNTGANAFSITTSGAGTIDVGAGGLVDLTGITLNSASTITVNGGGNTTLEVLNTTGNINVTSSGGSILAASGGSLLTGALVTLGAQTDIGAVGGQAVNTAASNLNLSATAGDIAVSQTGAATIDAATAGDEIAYAQSTGLLTIAGAVTSGASGITIDPPTDVAINAAVDGGSGSVVIDANNDITFNASGSIANASTVTLRADVDADNAGAIVDTQATTDITATGLVSLSAGDGIGNGDSLETSAGALSLATTAAASPIDVTEADGLTALTVSTNDSGVSVSFNAAADSLSFIAATDLLTFVAATTPVTFTTSGGIDFSGASSSTTAILSAGGAITDASGGIVTAALLNTSSDGGVTLDTGTHVIEAFTAVNTTGGAISLSNNTAVAALDVQAITQAGGAAVTISESDDAINLSGALSAAGSTVTLSSGSTISDAAGGIVTAGVLDTTSVGGTTLNTGTHVVEAFTASNATGGDILLTNDTAGGTLGVQVITQAAGGANAVTISETDVMSLSGALGGADNTVTLSSGGTISDAAGGIVTAGVLDTTSVGGTTLNTGTHVVEAFTASNATGGDILLTNNTAGGTLGVQAITQVAGGANAVTITETDAISLSGALGGADNTVTLSSGGTISDAAGGIVTAGVLDTTSVGGLTLSTGTHAVESFTAMNATGGGILLTNNTAGGTLNVQGITQVAGGANAVTITETDSIGVSGALNGADNVVALAAGGSISGAGLITGSSVTLAAAAGITASTEAGTLSAVNGAAAGNVTITESSGVQVNALSNASAGGTLSLTSAGAIDLNSNITTAGGSISLDAGGNALTLLANALIDSTNGDTAPPGGDISFAAGTTIDGDASGTRSLDLSAGDNGTVTVASAVGGINPLLSFTVRGGPGTTAVTDRAAQADLQAVTTNGGDIIVVANAINANGALTTLGPSGGTLTIEGGGITLGASPVVGASNITLRGNGGADQDLIITAALTSATTINLSATRDIIVQNLIDTSSGAAANITLTADSDLVGNGGVLVDAGGELRAGKDITLTGSALNSAIVGAATGDSVAVAAGGIVNSGQNAGSGGGNILLAAGTNAPATADIFVQGTVSTAGTTSGGTTTMNSARDIRLGSTAIATNGGAVTFQDNVELDAATTVTNNVSGGVANVTFAGAVNGAFDLIVNSSGISSFNGAVTTSSLTTDAGGATAIGAGGMAVTTTGSQTYNDAVTFAAASTLTSGGDLVLSAGGTSSAGDLTLIADGGFTLGGALAAAGRIVTLDTNSASTVFIGADNAIGLGLSDAEIGLITSSLLRIGQLAGPTNDTVTFNGAVSAAGKTLAVRTTGAGGAITGNPGIAADGFGLHITTTPQAISLLNASNAITNVALDSGGADISFGQLGSFTVATVDGIVGVNATTANNVNLASPNGTIGQAAGALVIANQLTTTSTGGVGLGVEANQVSAFSATNTGGGTIALNNTVGDLDIVGIAADGANVTLLTAGDSAANDSLTQSGAITGTAVLNATATTGNVNLPGANVVAGFAGSAVNGSAIFNNTSSTLALGPLSANTVSVTNSDAITSAGTVTTTAALSLSAGGPLVASTVTGGTLALTSSGRIVVDDDGFSTSQLTINPAGARNVRLGGAVTVDSAAITGVDADDLVILSGPATVTANVATGGYRLAFTNAAPVTLGGGVSSISTGAGDLGLFAGVSPPAGALTLTAGTTILGGAIAMAPGSLLTIDSALNLTSKTQLTTDALSLFGAVTGSDLTILRTTSANAVIGGSDPVFGQMNLNQFSAYSGTLSLGGERTVAPGSGANLLGNVEITGLLKTAGDIFLAGAGNINFNNSAAGVGRVESTKTDGVVSIAALGSSSVEGSGNITDTGLFNSFANPNRVAVAVGSSGTIELLANNQIGTETGGGAKFNLSAPTLSVAQVAEGEAQVDNAVFSAENSESVQEILAAYSAPGLAISPFIGTGLRGAVLQNLIQTPSSTPKQEKGELGFIDEGVFLLPSTFTSPERAILMPILGDVDFPGDQRPEDPDADDEWLAFFEDVVREYIASRYPLAENATDAERAAVEAIITSELQAIIAFYDAVRERERTQLAAARLESEQPEADSNPDAEQQPDAVESDTPLQQSALPAEGRTLGYIGRPWSGGGIGFEVRG